MNVGGEGDAHLDQDVLHSVIGGDAGHAHLRALDEVVQAGDPRVRALHLVDIVGRNPSSFIVIAIRRLRLYDKSDQRANLSEERLRRTQGAGVVLLRLDGALLLARDELLLLLLLEALLD